MSNENYRTPNSELDVTNVNLVKTSVKVKGIVLLLLIAWLCLSLAKIVPEFSVTFNAFGANLPLLTRLSVLLSPFYIWFAWFNVAFLVVWLISLIFKKAELKLYKFIKYNFFIFLAIFILVIVSMYLPIFMLGEVV